MNKKILGVILAVFVVLVALIFNVKKGSCPFSGQGQNKVSLANTLNQAKELETGGDILEAKAVYQKLINDFPSSREIPSWQKKSEELNIRLLFSPTITPDSVLYEIKPGDTLNKIAREFKTTVELISKSNNISGDRIVPGRKIKVRTLPFNILVDKSQNTLLLKSGDEIVKSYLVSTGANNCTPVGTFKIVNKLLNPTWFKAGAVVAPESPDNILGSRWMGFEISGYGIHGTTEPQSLGRQVTKGCVRMANPEVEELYSIVPVGTEVTIVD